MNARLAVAVSVVVIVLLAAGFLTTMQPGSTTSTGFQSTTPVGTSSSYVNNPQNLQLRLSVNASSEGSAVTIRILAEEYNTLASANNVSMGRQWGLNGLSLGTCGTTIYPFGVALYRGTYTAGNVSQAEPLRIYPVVACPMLIRYITGYLFQPTSNLAVILPSGPNATATPMSANVTATAEYAVGVGVTPSSTPLAPGTYTAVAGDEWGSVVVVHFTVSAGTSTSSSTSTSAGVGTVGTLQASFDVGPTQPVCMANATSGPAPSQYSSIEAVVTPQSTQALTLPISWLSNGCSVSGSLDATLAPGSYSLSLTSCQWMGCSSALPKSFVIVAGQATGVNVSIDTGIR